MSISLTFDERGDYSRNLMSRSPNLRTNQWFRLRDRPTPNPAACSTRWDLPWSADTRPTERLINQMRTVCSSCPILVHCADHALHDNSGNGAAGGMYAGVWVPWMSHPERDSREKRIHARTILRRVMRAGTLIDAR